MRQFYHIIIAVGANLEHDKKSARVTCLEAVATIRSIPGVRVLSISHWYKSAPVPPLEQPFYVNGVLSCIVKHDPFLLLSFLHEIERNCGRVRSIPNAPRTLDLDLITYGSLCLDTPRLVLPHPRAHERAFVLVPLSDICPDWVHPQLGYDMLQMLEAVQGQEIKRLEI
ncbi:MAG: 2-amino-4-hydroxy-6-hydroxymethyldihydropteridine diphosphokinase [Acetobacter sp.]|nr:2-amino-4-hydroxy-6-hydroxymethyldihydropteridine diphosphokinase [Acetobacter sp.]